jgi:hypothetical protein
MGVSGQRHAPAALLPPGKGPSVPIVQEAGWAPEPVWTQRLELRFRWFGTLMYWPRVVRKMFWFGSDLVRKVPDLKSRISSAIWWTRHLNFRFHESWEHLLTSWATTSFSTTAQWIQQHKSVVLGGVIVSVLAIGPKVRGFTSGRGRSIFRGYKSL